MFLLWFWCNSASFSTINHIHSCCLQLEESNQHSADETLEEHPGVNSTPAVRRSTLRQEDTETKVLQFHLLTPQVPTRRE